jgi:glycosyltransferase involved in cell wall biosynthesis
MKCSVLINTFNHADYIVACVESVLAQTRHADEIIVVDDGSTDATRDVLRPFGGRVTILRREHTGLAPHLSQAEAINEAFARASGSLIFLLDGDDTFFPEKVSAYAEAFRSHPEAVLIQSPVLKIDAAGRELGLLRHPSAPAQSGLRQIYRQQMPLDFYPSSALAFSRFYLERILPLRFESEEPIWADTYLAAIAPYFGEVFTLDEPLTRWRRHPAACSIRDPARRQALDQERHSIRAFNHFCSLHGLKPVRPWKSPAFLARSFAARVQTLLPAPSLSLPASE